MLFSLFSLLCLLIHLKFFGSQTYQIFFMVCFLFLKKFFSTLYHKYILLHYLAIYWVGQKVRSDFSIKISWKTLNELFGQPNIYVYLYIHISMFNPREIVLCVH